MSARSFLFLGVLCGVLSTAAAAQTFCLDGSAGDFSCEGVDLLAHLSQEELGSPDARGNDIWGWTDPETGKEYALMGLSTGTVFVDVSTPVTPVVIGWLPTATASSTWRDIKTIGNYAYIVSEASDHGVQVIDLTRLEDVTNPPVEFEADAHYVGVGQTHNIVALEEANLVIPVGSRFGPAACSGGLDMVDVSDPLSPTSVGCYADEQNAYVHDAQCVVYDGPDTEHVGKDICFTSSVGFVAIVDITDPSSPELINRMFYPSTSYTHQGWLTDDQAWFAVNDETDSGTTRTMFFDVSDLEMGDLAYTRLGPTQATDHNLYIRDSLMHQTNYTAGYRLWDISAPEDEESVNEIAWFDTHPENNDHGTIGGTWSNYPFFESGIVIASDKDRGLFVLDPTPSAVATSMTFVAPEAGPGDVVTLSVSIRNRSDANVSGTVFSNALPDGLAFSGNITASSGSAAEENGTVTWTVDVAADSIETLSFDVLIDEGVSPGTIHNSAVVAPSGEDSYETSASILIRNQPDLAFTATPEMVLPTDGYPDNCAVSELDVPESISFEEVRLGVTVDHTWRGDLVISLESPSGTSATLLDRVGVGTYGSNAENLDALVMTGGALEAFGNENSHDTAAPFYEIRGAPEQGHPGSETLGSMDDFADSDTQGTWTLTACDVFHEDEGVLLRWGLLFYGASVAGDVGPAELADVLGTPNPNPVRGTATFTLAVERGQDVTVEVFDITGRRLQTLYEGVLPADAAETLELDASVLPAGVYMIRATGEDFMTTRRVTVAR